VDLVVYFDVQGAVAGGVLDALTTSLRVRAETYDGTRVAGEQLVQVVP